MRVLCGRIGSKWEWDRIAEKAKSNSFGFAGERGESDPLDLVWRFNWRWIRCLSFVFGFGYLEFIPFIELLGEFWQICLKMIDFYFVLIVVSNQVIRMFVIDIKRENICILFQIAFFNVIYILQLSVFLFCKFNYSCS